MYITDLTPTSPARLGDPLPPIPRRNLARSGNAKQIPVVEAKKKVLDAIASGQKVAQACAIVGRAVETYRDWYKNDPDFKAAIQELRQSKRIADETGRLPVPDFETFCADYLHQPLFPHQLRWVDIIEGREPRDLHPTMVYEPGDVNRLLFNVPPNHAKTTSISVNYAVWRIHKDPNIKIAIISKSQGLSKKILGAIKTRLTSNSYRDMHLKFAPDGGWRDPDGSWNATQIYVFGKNDGEKDPTVEAVGLGGSIYGGRFDLIIIDDAIDLENAHRWEDQVDWLTTIIDSRLPPSGGTLIVVGTRISATDLNSELRQLSDEDDGQFFTYFSQPAVLDYGEGKSETWETLWPYTNSEDGAKGAHLRCMSCYALPDDCVCDRNRIVWMETRWDGKRLAKRRFSMGERRWSLVWQQQQIPDDATFPQHYVETSINRARQVGAMTEIGMGHREGGMRGLYVIGGLDPATVGNTAMIVCGLDRITGKRWLLDGFNQKGTSPAGMRDAVKRLTDQYHINEWVIERNAFQRFLTQDPDLNAFLRSRGCKLTEHYTTGNKLDPDFGVMSLVPLFESTGRAPSGNTGGHYKRVTEGDLIELPNDRNSGWCTELVKQLIAWEPSGLAQSQKTDLVMALWFTDIAAKRILGIGQRNLTHLQNPYASRNRLRDRGSINLVDLRAALIEEREAV